MVVLSLILSLCLTPYPDCLSTAIHFTLLSPLLQYGNTTFLILNSQGILRHLYFNETILQALNAPRIHHQLIPMELQYEDDLDADIVQAFRDIGHRMAKMSADAGFAAVTAIAREGNKLSSIYDRRRLGSYSIF